MVSQICNKLAHDISGVYIKQDVWISAVHSSGKDNTIADSMSRSLNDDTEWSLQTANFCKVGNIFGFYAEMHLFELYLN